MKSIVFLLTALIGLSVTAQTDNLDWNNQSNVVRAAERLASEVEQFDESLHDVNAPAHLVQKVHHFEETVQEFVLLARTGTYQQAMGEFNHIRADFQVIRQEMNQHPYLMQNYKVNTEYQHTRTAYRALDHEMFMHDKVRWNDARVKKLMQDLTELDAAH